MCNQNSSFEKAVYACPDLVLQIGMRAVSHVNREKIRPQNSRSLTGSVDLDKDLRDQFPAEHRWDYVVGYKGCDGEEKAFFIEVHPAETSEIKTVIRKARNLKAWAELNALRLWNMNSPREIHWVSSGRCNLRLNDSYRRQLALAGVGSPKGHMVLK